MEKYSLIDIFQNSMRHAGNGYDEMVVFMLRTMRRMIGGMFLMIFKSIMNKWHLADRDAEFKN